METAGFIIQWSLYGLASAFVMLAFPFMIISFRLRPDAPPRIRRQLPATIETADFEIIEEGKSA